MKNSINISLLRVHVGEPKKKKKLVFWLSSTFTVHDIITCKLQTLENFYKNPTAIKSFNNCATIRNMPWTSKCIEIGKRVHN